MHRKTDTLIAKGNHLADEAAKQAAVGNHMGTLLVAEDCEHLTTLSSLISAQESRSSVLAWCPLLEQLKSELLRYVQHLNP